MRFNLGSLKSSTVFPAVLRTVGAYPGITVIASFFLACLSFIQYSRVQYSHDPTSFYFNNSHEYAQRYSLLREQQAADFLNSPDHINTTHGALESPKMCVGIATVARHTKEYVNATIGSLLAGMTAADRSEMQLMLFFAHTDPHQHPLYEESWVATLPDSLLNYTDGFGNVSLEQIRRWEETQDYKAKGIFDYAYLLDACYQTGASYIAMFEGDVLAVPGWFPRVQMALRQLERQSWGMPWLYLRLFYTEHYLGWNSEEWPTYLSYSVLTAIVLAVILILVRSRLPGLAHHTLLSNQSMCVIVGFCLPVAIVLYFLAGRLSMQPLSTGLHRMEKYGCCSQGMVIPHDMAPAVVKGLLHETPREYADQSLEWLAEHYGFARWVLRPALVQHIGFKSSKGAAVDDDREWHVWNYEFEQYFESKVKEEARLAECAYHGQSCR